MKKAAIATIVALLVLISTVLWFITKTEPANWGESIHFVIIIVLVVFGFYFAYRRFSSARQGQPAEDELSRKLMVKASSLAYFISLYMWVFAIYIKDRIEIDTEVLLGSGILGMAVIFAVSWIVLKIIGIRNE
ncbi:MAG: hypothetical protein IH591_16335 [Bacteroidales bacterium]|nr:hypothetical protein [Bacteroidales bacterium]